MNYEEPSVINKDTASQFNRLKIFKTDKKHLLTMNSVVKIGEPIRYIDIGQSGTDGVSSSQIIELEVYDSENNNIALGKEVSLIKGEPRSGSDITIITDGNHNNPFSYFECRGGIEGDNQTIIRLDLGRDYSDISNVKLWRQYEPNLIYNNTFIYGRNRNKELSWKFHDYKKDGMYSETEEGKAFFVRRKIDPDLLSPPVSIKTDGTESALIIIGEEIQVVDDFYAYTSTGIVSLKPEFKAALNENKNYVVDGITLWSPGQQLVSPQKEATSYDSLFSNMTVQQLDLSLWDTSNIHSMSQMFNGCSNLTDVDISTWDTVNVINMGSMFKDCQSLLKLDLISFDTDNVLFTDNMFLNCTSVTESYAKSSKEAILFNASIGKPDNVEFYVDLSPFYYTSYDRLYLTDDFKLCLNNNTNYVLNDNIIWEVGKPLPDPSSLNFNSTATMFKDSTANILDLGSWDTSSVIDMNGMFAQSTSTTINVSNFNTSNVTNMSLMFANTTASILDLSSFNTSNVTNMRWMFAFSAATEINVSSFNTNKVTDMNWMFYNSKANALNLSNFNTSNVTNMGSMFYGTTATTLDLSLWDTGSVIDMNGMFNRSNATVIDVSNFNTSNVTNMSGMFLNSKVNDLDVSSFDTSSVTNMSEMFSNTMATMIDVNNFDTSNVTNMSSMFSGANIEILDLSSFDMSNVNNTNNMFRYCTSVTHSYARTQADADKLNSISDNPDNINFVIK